ncbi:hypothetical protein ACHAWT_002709 [Skeletonema menzelii]
MENYTAEEVKDWILSSTGLEKPALLFVENGINGKKLLQMNIEDLRALGLTGLQSKKILREIPKHNSTTSTTITSCSYEAIEVEASSAKDTAPKNNLESAPSERVTTMTTTTTSTAFGCETKIEGFESQMVTIHLAEGQSVQSEPGALIYMSAGVEYITKTDGKGFQRFFTGQRIFLTEWSYRGTANNNKGVVAFSADFPSRIIDINLAEYGGRIMCQRGSLLVCDSSIITKIAFVDRFGAGFFGGAGFILQELSGQGHVFLNAGGVITKIELQAGETIRCTTGALVGMQASVGYRVEMVGGLFDAWFGREGVFWTTLTGPGTVWLESLPRDKFTGAIYERLPKCPSQQEADEEAKKGKLIGKGIVGGLAFLDGATDGKKRFGA